ncbi:MAG: gliding motility protein GldL, partial [Bacteroidia bacterium]|nr:gliding motility protein GldL [Bacteroidia bacterium]
MSLAELVQSSGWKNFIAKLYGLGASVVIIGALFKIQHWPLAGTMLTIGLLTESVIFFFSAFEPLHEEVDWSLVYPELAGIPEDETTELAAHGGKHRGGISGGGGGGGAGSVALAKFDEMLEKAEITPDLFQKLGVGMKKLGDATSNMSVMGDISVAS